MKTKYKAPQIEVIEIEIEDAILGDSGLINEYNPSADITSINIMETTDW